MKKLIAALLLFTYFSACNNSKKNVIITENQLPVMWADMTLLITKNTPANSPTFASRSLGYIGLAMYESIVNSSPSYVSLAGQLNRLTTLPAPEKNKEYNWPLSLNAGQAAILRDIYIQTSKENKKKIDSLENLIYHSFADRLNNKEITDRSVAYGKAVASAIFEWSKTDGGHRGYLNNFDKKMVYPSHKGSWKPPFFAQTITRLPLHPHWGNNRTFLKADTNWKMPPFIFYDTSNISQCYKEFMEVYHSNKKLTQEQKETAIWWNDDPSETYSPPGHSYNLASTIVRLKKVDMVKAAETYARVGLAVADAFIVCWRMKYHFFSERPSSFVSENVDSDWDPFWPDPPFPSFPSGHATQAAAVASVLAGLYGDKVSFIDSSHAGRPRDALRDVEYKPRKFNSFHEVAVETAYSRFLGGIHTNDDNKIGLAEGGKVGQHINDLKWRN